MVREDAINPGYEKSAHTHRVLVVADAYPSRVWPDANPFIRAQVKALRALGCEVAVFVPTPYVPPMLRLPERQRRFADLPTHETLDDVRVLRPRYPRAPGHTFRQFAGPTIRLLLGGAFKDLIEQFKPTLIHAHMATPMGYAGLHWARRFRLPACVTLHGLDVTAYPDAGFGLRRQTLQTLTDANQLVAVSRYVAHTADALVHRKIATRVCYTGVDTTKFCPDEARRQDMRKQLGIASDARVLGFAGRMVAEKGLKYLVDIATRLRQRRFDFTVLVVGGGDGATAVTQALVDCLGQNAVVWVGAVPHETMPDHIRVCDILLHPSQTEGFGMVILEAQSCGVPVVATDVGGIPEATDAGNSAILIPNHTDGSVVDQFADAVAGLLNDPQRMRAMGLRGRAFAQEKFDIAKCTQELLTVYAQL